MHHSDTKIVKSSIIVLVVCILLVYALFYQIKWNKLVDNMSEELNSQTPNIKIYMKDWENVEEIISSGEKSQVTIDKSGYINDDIAYSGLEINYLSWTQLYYWILESVEKLWISYEYILKDDKNIYYIMLWKNNYDLVDIARKLGWSIYTINTEQEILKNQLFGEKVVFVNIPEYKNKLVLMLVDVNNQNWLLEIKYDLYHKSKPYLKSLFID